MHKEAIIDAYKRSTKRLLLLDYDGVLMPIVDRPELAAPTPELLELLKNIADDPHTTCVIISGRDHETLDAWLGALPLAFLAEHGLWSRQPSGPWVQDSPVDTIWKTEVRAVMSRYEKRLPGSFIEQKTASVGLHYRLADQQQANLLISQLVAELAPFASDKGLRILHGKKVVEVISAGVDKGAAAQRWVDKADWDFILAAGDDVTDEAMFKQLAGHAFTLSVGKDKTAARYHVVDQPEFMALLKSL